MNSASTGFAPLYTITVFVLMAVISAGLRALPFFAGRWLKHSSTVTRLGRFLPPAIMVLLLLHTLVGLAGQTNALLWPWREVLAAALAIALHLWRGSALLSILPSTALYMLLRSPLLG
ncbi:MAG: AzlD domain-containing protein [Rhodocyclaceae bacterium]|nr:AzlD domain-containing protein [Rhodocyclaceae bacterium]